MQYDAFIVAGGRAPWLKEAAGTDIRCLAPLHKKRMLDYVLQAMLESKRFRNIVIAVEADAIPLLEGTLPANVSLCAAGTDLPSTCIKAAEVLTKDDNIKILGVCDDIPLLTPAALNDFLDQCESCSEGELYYPIIPKDACLKAYPEAKRTYGKLADGTFTGGNMMLASKKVIVACQSKAEEIFERRKNPLKLGSWLGWSFILKLLLHLLTVAAAEKRTSELLGVKCKAIITPYPEIGMDVDKPADLQLAEKYLQP